MIRISSVLDLIKSLDEMQTRNSARLDSNDHTKIGQIKEQLVLIAMLSLGGEGMADFLKYCLLEGKIGYDL